MTACMGGWCTRRDRCRNHAQDDRSFVVERLCEPGTDDAFEPIPLVRRAGSWERTKPAVLLRPDTWLDVVEAA